MDNFLRAVYAVSGKPCLLLWALSGILLHVVHTLLLSGYLQWSHAGLSANGWQSFMIYVAGADMDTGYHLPTVDWHPNWAAHVWSHGRLDWPESHHAH